MARVGPWWVQGLFRWLCLGGTCLGGGGETGGVGGVGFVKGGFRAGLVWVWRWCRKGGGDWL